MVAFPLARAKHWTRSLLLRWARAMDAKPGAPSPDSENELRAWPRQRQTQTKVLLTTVGGVPFEGWILDRSLGGLGLSVSRPVEPGTVLLARATGSAVRAPRPQLEVKYCRLHRGRWRLGCQFVGIAPASNA
jgi:hypothetical protein